MSRSISRKNKKIILDDISKLEDMKVNLEVDLENQKDIVKYSRKNKNRTIMKSMVKFATPILISSVVVYGSGIVGGFGRPFVIDKEKSSKVYTLEVDQSLGLSTEETYKNITRNTHIPNSTFSITTPWVEVNNKYERNVYKYEEKELKDIDLYNAFITKDYDYILNNYSFKSSKVETSNNINANNNTEISAKLYIVDSNDNIYVSETSVRNLMVTLFEMLTVIATSSLIILGIKDKIFIDITRDVYEYDQDKKNYYKVLKKIETINSKIDLMKKKVKKYEK